MEDLVTATNEVLYEQYRTARLLAANGGAAPASDAGYVHSHALGVGGVRLSAGISFWGGQRQSAGAGGGGTAAAGAAAEGEGGEDAQCLPAKSAGARGQAQRADGQGPCRPARVAVRRWMWVRARSPRPCPRPTRPVHVQPPLLPTDPPCVYIRHRCARSMRRRSASWTRSGPSWKTRSGSWRRRANQKRSRRKSRAFSPKGARSSLSVCVGGERAEVGAVCGGPLGRDREGGSGACALVRLYVCVSCAL
jgi:hypothetical protein